MKTVIISGLDEDAAKEMKADFLSAHYVRQRLIKICEDKIKGAFEVTRSQYDSPNWQFKQADSAGYKRALEEVISLLS